MSTTAIVLAKRPQAGLVKTRMFPQLSYEQAAEVAAAALRDTLATVDAGGFDHCLLSFDGDPTGWLPEGWLLHRQPDGGLDERIVAAVEAAPDGPVLLVGMDTPHLSAYAMHEFDPVGYDACIGLATDGGYWAIGFANVWDAAATVLGVPMSVPSTGAEQLRRLHAAGLRVQLLDRLTDVDTFDTAQQVALQAPHTDFARTLRAMRSGAVA